MGKGHTGRIERLSLRTPDITIIVVHWNVPDLLRACLCSVERERCRSEQSIEVLVIDNASDAHPMDETMREFPDFDSLYLPGNVGFARASNIGFEQTSGQTVLLLNPDTDLLPGALESLWTVGQAARHIGLVAPLLLNPDGTLQSAGYRFPGLMNVALDYFPIHLRLTGSTLNGRIHPDDGVSPVAIDYPLGAAMFFRREAIDDIGGFDERYFMYSEEVDVAQRLAQHGWTRVLAPAARVIHHGGQSTGQQPTPMYQALWRSRYQYFKHWLSPGKQRLVKLLVIIGTRWDDRKAEPERRAANAKIRSLFRNGPGTDE